MKIQAYKKATSHDGCGFIWVFTLLTITLLVYRELALKKHGISIIGKSIYHRLKNLSENLEKRC
jgi:hypothetical protein